MRPGYIILVVSLVLAAAWPAPVTGETADAAWWSLQPVRRPAVPTVKAADRVATPIDAFILARLEERGLSLSPPADRLTLIRRATFDLIGLPPTPAQVDAFIADDKPDAYERMIDRLLASPNYGQRWGRHWLDVVRFSESNGYERDRIRPNAWRYRDWVIAALNNDVPYDQFVRQQLAGDVLAKRDPQTNDDAIFATGFLVTGPNNDVPNRAPIERMRDRMDELDDFVVNTSGALLGLTVGCARCHDHKFDPIPTRDYYRLVAALAGVKYGDRQIIAPANQQRAAELDEQIKARQASIADLDKQRKANQTGGVDPHQRTEKLAPTLARFVRFTIQRTQDGAEPCIDEIEVYGPDKDRNLALASAGAKATASSLLPGYAIHQITHLNDGQHGNAHSWISNEKGKGWAQIELPQPARVERIVWGRDRPGQYADRVPADYVIAVSDDGKTWRTVVTHAGVADAQVAARLKAQLNTARGELKKLQTQRNDLSVTAWAVVSAKPDTIHVLPRGDVTTPGEQVSPGALSVVSALPADLTTDNTAGADDGSGAEASDGDRRLALADWIASPRNPLTARVMVNRIWQYHFGVGLVDTPSDLGASGARPTHPRLLDWLADRFVRDGWSIKAMHRLIMRSSVYRQQCAANAAAGSVDADNRLLWKMNRRRLEAEDIRDAILATSGRLDRMIGGPSYRTFNYIEGNIPVYEPMSNNAPDTWRRTVYRHAIRSHSSPFLDVFDCPDSSVMTPRRARTTTPLQALSLLNNEFVLGQSESFAQRLVKEAGADPAAQVQRAYRLVFNRPANDRETQRAVAFVREYGLPGLCRVLWNANEFLYVN